jgi:hypothetical protein
MTTTYTLTLRPEDAMNLYVALAIVLMLVPYPSPLRRVAVAGCIVLGVVFAVVGIEVMATFLGDGVVMASAFLALALGFLIRAYVTWRGVRSRHLAASGNR